MIPIKRNEKISFFDFEEEKAFLQCAGFKWIHEKEEFLPRQYVKVAELTYELQGYLIQRVEVFLMALPARFLKMKAFLNDGRIITFSTGNMGHDSIIYFIKKILPMIELMSQGLLDIEMKQGD